MDITFTNRELDVMAVLWTWGSATVAEVRAQLDDDLAYTTVLSVLRNLEEKGYVAHTEEGKAHRYRPLVDRRDAGSTALERIVDKVFQGSNELLLTQFVSERRLTSAELRKLARLIDKKLEDED